MWLVGYLFNTNGMGTWCWEAAHALAEQGEQVTLVCSADVVLPGPTRLPILRIAPAARPISTVGKIAEALGALSAEGPRVMHSAVQALKNAGTPVSVVLLNSTEFHDSRISAPQLVTAWAGGVTLREYAQRLRIHLRGWTRESARIVLGTVGWWRKDWRAYRRADVVLAVTERLHLELRSHGVSAATLHPCTHASARAPAARPPGSPVRLLIAAAVLGEPRKRVAWMLEALRDVPVGSCTLTLIGTPSDALVASALSLRISALFTGALSREDTVRRMSGHDVLLFGSVLDDWGYVVTEAMGQGLAIVAPDASPFDEIVGDAGTLYAARNRTAFLASVLALLPVADAARHRAWRRARAQFSREAFVRRLRLIVAERLSHRG